MMRHGFTTRETIIDALRDGDQDAWLRCYGVYSDLIIAFSLSCGCDELAAREIHQETMIQLLSVLPNFQYDAQKGSFRNFLRAIAHNRIRRHLASLSEDRALHVRMDARQITSDAPMALHYTATNPSPAELWEALYENKLRLMALERVRSRAAEVTFRSDELNVLQEIPVLDVAKQLGITANAIYQHKNRIKQMLKQELMNLKREMES